MNLIGKLFAEVLELPRLPTRILRALGEAADPDDDAAVQTMLSAPDRLIVKVQTVLREDS